MMLRLLIPKPVVFNRLKQNLRRYFSWPVVNTGDLKVRLRPVSNAHNWMGTIIADIERMSTCPELKRWFANLLHVVVEVRYVNNSWSRRGGHVAVRGRECESTRPGHTAIARSSPALSFALPMLHFSDSIAFFSAGDVRKQCWNLNLFAALIMAAASGFFILTIVRTDRCFRWAVNFGNTMPLTYLVSFIVALLWVVLSPNCHKLLIQVLDSIIQIQLFCYFYYWTCVLRVPIPTRPAALISAICRSFDSWSWIFRQISSY